MPLESLLLAADEPDATPVIQSASATGQKDARLGLGPGLGVGVGDGDGDLDERSSSPLFPTPSSPPALPLPLPLPLPSLPIASSAPVASVAAAAATPGSTTLPLPTTAPPPPATASTTATATSPPVSPQDLPPTEPPPPRSPVKALNPTPAPTIADTTKENIVASSRRSSGSSSHNQSAPSSSAAAPTSKPSRSSGVSSSASLTAKVQHKVVFVDPDDVNAPWWWPAIVVPQKEFQEFRKTVNIEIDEPKEGEYLVCYFEDGSFSTIPTTAATAFHPRQHPYTAYLNGSYGSNFKRDNAVRLATDYFENGVVPPSFAWLNGMPAVPLADLTPLDAVPQGSNTKKSRTNNQQLGSIDATGTAKRNGNASRSGNGAPTATGSDTKKRRDPNGANGSGTRKPSPPSNGSSSVGSRSKTVASASIAPVAASPINNKKGPNNALRLEKVEQLQRESSSVEPSPGLNGQNARKLSSAALFGNVVHTNSGAKRNPKDVNGLVVKPAHSTSPPRSTAPIPQQQQQPISSANAFRARQPTTGVPQPAQLTSQIYATAICAMCGKPIGNCLCATTAASFQHFQVQQFQPVSSATATTSAAHIHQVGALQYTAPLPSQYPKPNTSSSAASTTTMGYYTQRPVVSTFEAAQATTPTTTNPFAPICVLKRSERPDPVMLKDLVPVAKRRNVFAVLSRRGEAMDVDT